MIHKNKKIKTKNLYSAELCTMDRDYCPAGVIHVGTSFNPRRFIIVRKKEKSPIDCYIDIFTKSKYYLYDNCYNENGDIVLANLQPACTNQDTIRYKDADKLFQKLNASYIKK